MFDVINKYYVSVQKFIDEHIIKYNTDDNF